MIKICPICNQSFESINGTKYCSQECRRRAEYARHNAWAQRTNYTEKQRDKMRERRRKEAEDHREHLRQMHEERLKQIEEEKERADLELQERATAGDHKALMELAKRAGDMVEYYTHYALYEIETEERDFGRKSTRTINDISVYDPDFGRLVVESIKATGRCINKTNGLGEKLEALL